MRGDEDYEVLIRRFFDGRTDHWNARIEGWEVGESEAIFLKAASLKSLLTKVNRKILKLEELRNA